MKPKIKSPGNKLSEKDIQKKEKRKKIQIPEDYKYFLLETNGGMPDPDHYKTPKVIDPREEEYMIHSFFEFEYIDTLPMDHMPPDIYVIGDDPGGNFFCICMSGKNKGKIYFWHHETVNEDVKFDYANLILIANSFTEFINGFNYDSDLAGIDLLIEKNDIRKIENLLNSGMNPNSFTNNGYPILREAIRINRPEIISILLKKGAEFKPEYITIASQNDLATIKTLLNAEININLKNKNGTTFLISSSENAEIESIIYLLKEGADPEIKNNNGETALDVAKRLLSDPMRNTHHEKYKKIIEILEDRNSRN